MVTKLISLPAVNITQSTILNVYGMASYLQKTYQYAILCI